MSIPSHSKDPADLIAVGGSIGEQMYSYVSEMFPICRSITGNGVRETLKIIQGLLPLQVHEVPSGTKVFDWEVPKEWNIKSAYIKNSKGQKVLDFADCNLHVLNYSVPVHKKVSWQELQSHLFHLQEHPDWIPYRTSYYKEDWGFCMSYNQFLTLQDDIYEVFIDSTLSPGHLSYGEYYIPGETTDEVLISAHICHPSLANDNLSGISVSTFLAKHLQEKKTRYSYRFLFIPGTIGAITWLALNEATTGRIKHGLVLSLLGDTGNFTYKKSRQDTSEIDRIAEYVLKFRNSANKVIEFIPYGYDERQFCSPGFNMAVGCLSRTTYGQYIQYHTSADNLSFIRPKQLEESLQVTTEIVETLEANQKYLNLNPKCEPQLGKRGLYNLKGGNNEAKEFQMALLWTLNLSDGRHSTLDIAKRSGIHFRLIAEAVNRLLDCKLLQEAN
jgi:aminopeptidase-like protein